MGKKWVVRLAAYGSAFAANVGYFWWSWDVGLLQAAAAGLYAAVCIWFLWSGRRKRPLMRTEMLLGGLTAAAGLMGLLTRAGLTWLTLPALLLSGVFITPLYGFMGLVPDYDVGYGAVVILGLLWMLAGWYFWKRQNEG